MARLPQLSGRELVQALSRFEYEIIRQKGSHIRLRKRTSAGEHNVTVPDHAVVAKGTLNDILKSVAAWHGISRDDLLRQLALIG